MQFVQTGERDVPREGLLHDAADAGELSADGLHVAADEDRSLTSFLSARSKFCGGDGLADVALGVVGAVDEQAGDGGGEGGATDAARGVVLLGRESADASGGGAQGGVEFGEDRVAGGVGIEFGAEGGELSCVELGAFGVAEQAVEAAGDVADVEGYGREAEWAGVDFRASEVGAPFGDVFFGEFERMEDGTLDGIDFGEGAAEPGFWL